MSLQAILHVDVDENVTSTHATNYWTAMTLNRMPQWRRHKAVWWLCNM